MATLIFQRHFFFSMQISKIKKPRIGLDAITIDNNSTGSILIKFQTTTDYGTFEI